MDLLSFFLPAALLVLAGLLFLFWGDKLFWLLPLPLGFVLGALPVAVVLSNSSIMGEVEWLLAIGGLLGVAAIAALYYFRPRPMTYIMAPLLAGAALVLHGLMYVTGGALQLLIAAGMGGALPFLFNAALVLLLLGAIVTLVAARKSPRWVRIAVSTLYGMLFTALGLVIVFVVLGSGDIYYTDGYLLGLVVSLPIAALGIYLQRRRFRRAAPDAAANVAEQIS